MCGGRGRAPRATYTALPYAPTYHLARASPRQPGARGPPTRRQPPPAAARARGRFSAGGAIVPAAHGSPRVCIPPDAAAHTLYSAVAVCTPGPPALCVFAAKHRTKQRHGNL
jgi:hypothetical protein